MQLFSTTCALMKYIGLTMVQAYDGYIDLYDIGQSIEFNM